MFFPHDILVKYPSLGQAWLAATIGNSENCKKLQKLTIVQFNIDEVCNFILDPPYPLSIRLSSQLMLGIVRILKYKIIIALSQCHQVYEHLHKSQYTLKATKLSETTLMLDQSYRLNKITLSENNEILIGMQIDQLLGSKLFEQMEIGRYKTPSTPGRLPLVQASSFTSPSIILDGDTLTLMERAEGTGEEPLGLEIEQDYELGEFELPKLPPLYTLPPTIQEEEEFVLPISAKREQPSKKVKFDEIVVFSKRDLFRTFDQVTEDTGRELEEYETKRKYRNELKGYLTIFTEPLIPLCIPGEEEFYKNTLNAVVPPMEVEHAASFAASISPLAGFSPIPSVRGAGDISIEEQRREGTQSPAIPMMEMPWNLQGYENYLTSEGFNQLSFQSFMEQNQSQLLEYQDTISIPVNLLQSSIIRPSSPIQFLETLSPSNRAEIPSSKLNLNTDELNFYKLLKDFNDHQGSQSTKFTQLVPKGQAKLVAAKAFYNLLVLKSKALVNINQLGPYEEIYIIPV